MSALKEKTQKQGLLLSRADRQLQGVIDKYALLNQRIQEILEGKYPEKTHIVSEGETLRALARYYYKDVSLWKKLGLYNHLQSTTLTKGQTINIPPREVLTEYGA